MVDRTNTPPDPDFPTPATPSTQTQRFSLVSRRARGRAARASQPYEGRGAKHPAALAFPELKLPESLIGSLRECIVTPCQHCRPCREGSVTDVRRLCERDTGDHVEFELLAELGKRFDKETGDSAASCHAFYGQGPPSVNVARKAANQELDVHFVILPDGTTVGYVALGPEAKHRPPMEMMGTGGRMATRELVQLYIEPGHRRQGIATSALRVLLAGDRPVLVKTRAAQVSGERNEDFGRGGGIRAYPPGVPHEVIGLLARVGFKFTCILDEHALFQRQGMGSLENIIYCDENENENMANVH